MSTMVRLPSQLASAERVTSEIILGRGRERDGRKRTGVQPDVRLAQTGRPAARERSALLQCF